MSTTATATSTTNKRSSKRFSFAGFSLFNKTSAAEKSQPPPSPPSQKQEQQKEQDSDDERRRSRRAQKSQSLYLQSFRNLTNKRPTSAQYDPAEANQANHKEVRSTIRRSLSAVLYATPQQQKQQSSGSAGLVPVLVTQDLSDRHGGMITPHDESANKKKAQEKEAEAAATKEKKQQQAIEYDNTLDIIPDSKKEELVIIWQGYGYTQPINSTDSNKRNIDVAKQELDDRFEKEVWTKYRGLIHPLHLFQDADDENEGQDKWGALSVEELRRYFDNYGSMLLKLRDRSMMRQQRQYLVMNNKAKDDWILPQATEAASAPRTPTSDAAAAAAAASASASASVAETCNS
ncbi:hypothetical protein BDB00DRAFT_228095 [Zychaea mexicana]|uniref:uncharacterized protein n=1 Tax=Zychaea mexicana TaxID=64656 RepID=UPI0022FEA451|nr:uncharacterized protein BDB00DRAFT_228095 [Zychaea mexicana]KAI9499298.1 hypothetical protein BDB00DRAFT_228095 [Zychaea mexicana]